MNSKAQFIYDNLETMFPDAHCELNYKTHFELLIAVVLSAQTTDKGVNKATVALFEHFPDALAMSQADARQIEEDIRTIGLYRNKARNVKALSQALVERFDGVVPSSMEELTSLPGVGRKTANVVMSELFDIPAIAVDTHVERVSKRLKIAREADDVLTVEKKLMKLFPKECWHKLHHLLIFFGRYFCTAKKPNCIECPLKDICRKNKHI